MTESPISSSSARIFDIQRLALDDGPGIRTNIFFKGCPLRCIWCHNPESYVLEAQLDYNPQLCVNCGLCAEACEYGVHEFRVSRGLTRHLVAHDRCTGCGECLKVCCYNALNLAGEDYTAEELAESITVDLPYYRLGSGGGVTLSGGEPMMQWRFIDTFLDRLDGVHVSIETSGQAPPEAFKKILPKVDLFLYDVKATDSEKHRQLCGVGNELIMENLELLCRSSVPVVLRLPLIPTVNDDDEHLTAIVDLIHRYPSIQYAQILPYHNFGNSKLERFGMLPRMKNLPTSDEETKQSWLRRFADLGAEDIRCL